MNLELSGILFCFHGETSVLHCRFETDLQIEVHPTIRVSRMLAHLVLSFEWCLFSWCHTCATRLPWWPRTHGGSIWCIWSDVQLVGFLVLLFGNAASSSTLWALCTVFYHLGIIFSFMPFDAEGSCDLDNFRGRHLEADWQLQKVCRTLDASWSDSATSRAGVDEDDVCFSIGSSAPITQWATVDQWSRNVLECAPKVLEYQEGDRSTKYGNFIQRPSLMPVHQKVRHLLDQSREPFWRQLWKTITTLSYNKFCK